MQNENDFLRRLAAYLIEAATAKEGKAPSERELAEHFGVSRGQVREALAILEAVRVIERRAKSGIYLRHNSGDIEQLAFFARTGLALSARQIYEAAEMRKLHEIKAAELAAEKATDENLAALERILETSEQKLVSGGSLEQLDRDFHLEIARATQNSVFYSLCEIFFSLTEPRSQIYFRSGERNRRSHREHQQIFAALQDRDSTLSMALMNAHFKGAMQYLKELHEPADASASDGSSEATRRTRQEH